jgi:hypothetical protein
MMAASLPPTALHVQRLSNSINAVVLDPLITAAKATIIEYL